MRLPQIFMADVSFGSDRRSGASPVGYYVICDQPSFCHHRLPYEWRQKDGWI